MHPEAWIQKSMALLLVVCLLVHSRPSNAQAGGAWTDVIPLPVIPVAAALLPNGKVLIWQSSASQFEFPGDLGTAPSQTYTAIFDPATGSSVQRIETEALSDMFCPGIAYLADGGLVVNGGDSSPKTSIYDSVTQTWSAGGDMNIPRGYNADVLLTTGEVLTLGGSWSGEGAEKIGEVWSPTTGEWSLRSGISAQPITGPDPEGVYRGDNHPWLFAVTNGYVFHAGPSAEMHWITTAGDGSIVSAGTRDDDAYSINGKAVQYGVGKILKTGGAPAYENAWATADTYVIDINPTVADPLNQSVVVTKTAPMAYPRAFANGVVLPNGQVLIVGGTTYALPFSDDLSVLVPELWDPVDETFTQLTPMKTPRNYHSTALLLPDGRVFVGGGGLCAAAGCKTNHPDAEIFSPPYLFNLDGTPATRPKIVSAPSTAQLGSTISVTTNTPVTEFAILRLSAVTHSVDNDQRHIPLEITSASQKSYDLSIPSDPGVVSPGFYMLFAINPQGTPSVAAIIPFG